MKKKLWPSIFIFSVILFFASCKKQDNTIKVEASSSGSQSATYSSTTQTNAYEESGITKNVAYAYMINQLNERIDKVLLETKPPEIALSNYKVKLIEGGYSLSVEQQEKISEISTPLAEYGRYLAERNNIEIPPDDLSSQYALGAINSLGLGLQKPDKPIVKIDGDLTGGEIAECALQAIGVTGAWSVGFSTNTTWAWSAIRQSFKNAVTRMLGPWGAAIAVAVFTYCLYKENQDYQVPVEIISHQGNPILSQLPDFIRVVLFKD